METGHAGAEVHHCWVYAEHREDRINARSESPLRAFFIFINKDTNKCEYKT